MSNLAEQIVDIIGQSSKLLGIMYFIVNIKKIRWKDLQLFRNNLSTSFMGCFCKFQDFTRTVDMCFFKLITFYFSFILYLVLFRSSTQIHYSPINRSITSSEQNSFLHCFQLIQWQTNYQGFINSSRASLYTACQTLTISQAYNIQNTA